MSAETISKRIVAQHAKELSREKQMLLQQEVELVLLRQLEQLRLEFYRQGFEDARRKFYKE